MFIADSNFLIPNATFIVELVAFLVVLAFIGKYVLPYLKKALDERAALIGSQLAAADEAKADASAADDERRAALEEARHAGPEIVAQANRTAERCAPTPRPGAEEYERIVGSAEAEVALARQRAVEEAANRWARS
jgi:F-type H+-transporting ATPase subunit b